MFKTFILKQSVSCLVKRHLSANVAVATSENGIATLSLIRSEGKNSFSKQMLIDFNSAVSKLQSDKNVRVLIVKSTVEKVFCAGADLKERAGMPDDQVGAFVASLRDAFTSLADLPFPTIAAIEGVALGGGLELALACDLRVAGEKALLGLPETSLAIIPGAGGTQRLSRVVGLAKAKELVFTSARLTALDASKIGLITEVVPFGEAVSRAEAIAAVIAEKGPLAIRMAKKALDGGFELDLKSGLALEKECYEKVVPTTDRKEGLLAFTEKRKPVYTGK
jgi:methylglutaconyl-CoA hydratase